MPKVMAALIMNNGYCPFCKEDLAITRTVEKYRLNDSDVIEKHIRDKKEASRWQSGIKTIEHLSGR